MNLIFHDIITYINLIFQNVKLIQALLFAVICLLGYVACSAEPDPIFQMKGRILKFKKMKKFGCLAAKKGAKKGKGKGHKGHKGHKHKGRKINY